MSSSHDSDAGRTSVRTTIVGGQPPGNARPLGEIPIGMERLLGLAAMDERLAAELERDPAALAEGCGIDLEPTELSVLQATPKAALRGMLNGIRAGLEEPARREFIHRAALVTAALFTAGAAVAGCKKTTPDPAPSSGSGSGAGAPDMQPPPDDMGPPPDDMAVPPARKTATPDASAPPPPPPRKPPRYTDQIRRGISPRRPRLRESPAPTGIRPK